MKVIFLTQYFPPETGAPQNRLFATAKALQEGGAEVTVLTGMPNYPEMRVQEAYRGKLFVRERMDGLQVLRAWLLVSPKRSILWRLGNYFSFVFTAFWVGTFKLKRSDVLFVESPPLFLGITALLLARMKRAKLVFNVSDLWPESAVQLGLVTNPLLIGLSTRLEMRCYRNSALITGQTKGIVANIKARCPEKEVIWLPNGVDLDAIRKAEATEGAMTRLQIRPGTLVLVYAGILGHAQGLEVIMDAALRLKDRTDVLFLLIGEGPDRVMLQELQAQRGLANVRFLGRIDRAEVLAILKESDAVVVPLRRNDLFLGAIPSKVFEALALSKPVLLGVDGEARDLFIREGEAGLFFEPENGDALAEAVRRYADDRGLVQLHGANGARYVRSYFDRTAISARLLEALQRITGRS